MRPSRSTSRKLAAVAALVLASVGVVAGQKAFELSADPSGEKDCSSQGLAMLPGSSGSAAVSSGTGGTPTSLSAAAATLPWTQRGGTLNDASCLNRTPVYGVVQVTSVDEIKSALEFAKSNSLKVSIAGARHSMGGHAF